MHIGLNARRLEGQRFGVGRYIEYLLTYWSRLLAGGDRVSVFVRAPLDTASLDLSDRIAVDVLRPRLSGVTWENAVLPVGARAVDVLFCPSYTAPLLFRGPMVVATHSVDVTSAETVTWQQRHLWDTLYRLSARRATRVVVPTEQTRREVAQTYGVDPGRIAVVPQGADDAFRPLRDGSLRSATRRQWLGADVPFILFVGKLSVRRNIPALIRAFAIVKRERRLPHKLLLLGPDHHNLRLAELIAELGLQGEVVQNDGRFRRHTDIVPVYNAADLFIHPSLYEGFSITTVEAFACGVPVVAANRGALAEIATGYARMVDDPSDRGLAAAIGEVLSSPAELARLRARSLERSQVYRWERTARETLEVLADAAGG